MTLSPTLVRELAAEAGFDLVRFGPADPGPDGPRFAAWLDAGRAGEMRYLHRNRARILDPRSWAPEARAAIDLAFDYGGPPGAIAGGARIARYAVGRDYHRALGNATRRLRSRLEREGVPRGTIKVGTDAVPVLERALSARAGVGFLAKSAGVISPHLGPYLLLSELLTPLDLPFDDPSAGSCGSCTRCLDACPTGAIVAPFEVDARRCLSYTTIELRGPIPEPLRAPQGSWLFGCDVCLEVCPFTSKGRAARPAGTPRPEALRPHPVVETFSLLGVLELDERAWAEQWTGTAMRRATRSGLRRNAAVVLGNLGDRAARRRAAPRARARDRPVGTGGAAGRAGRLVTPAGARGATACRPASTATKRRSERAFRPPGREAVERGRGGCRSGATSAAGARGRRSGAVAVRRRRQRAFGRARRAPARLAAPLLPGSPQRKPFSGARRPGKPPMDHRDFYQEMKWCDGCKSYVRYLMSVNDSYCIKCGTRVRLFSKEDAQRFSADVEKRKWRVS